MRFATCTPIAFSGEPRFFTRDTGLLCRGFQQAGLDCVVVMPGDKNPGEPDDLIRCSVFELVSTTWWKNSGIDVVILYAWGDPRYLPVAKAIRNAGIQLIQSLDTAGLYSPYADFKQWLQSSLSELALPQPPLSRARRLARMGRDLFPSIYERRRLVMLDECDHLAAVSPPARDSIEAYLLGLGRAEIAKKLTVIPHPVSSTMLYRGEEKQKKVLVVGRWGPADSAQKDPDLTLEVLCLFLGKHSDWKAEIIGPEALSLEKKVIHLNAAVRSRLAFRNFVQHNELRNLYAHSKVLLCASRFESFHIASAEAVCCGCSVVVAAHPLLASTTWFTHANSGTVARRRSRKAIFRALLADAELWEAGKRNPEGISSHWQKRLLSDHIPYSI